MAVFYHSFLVMNYKSHIKRLCKGSNYEEILKITNRKNVYLNL